MSNETKRDVFKNAAFNIETSSPDGQDFALELRQRYVAALPDDLPVIPKGVAEVIKYNKENAELAVVLMRAKANHQSDDWWINQHQDTFALAWVIGVWRVEETGEIVKLEEDHG